MHVPDGFLDLPTSVGTGAVAVVVVGVALRRARADLDDRAAPLAGLVATFLFAAQMLNFPVGAGTSGHLVGGALAAALVGPAMAILCMTVVLGVQCLLFADGGITALGTNIVLMGLVTVVTSEVITRATLALLPTKLSVVAPAVALGAFVSVPAAALGFVALYDVGGQVDVPIASLTLAMVGVHVLIGIGEALITGLVVSGVLSTRPDLVYAARAAVAARDAQEPVEAAA